MKALQAYCFYNTYRHDRALQAYSFGNTYRHDSNTSLLLTYRHEALCTRPWVTRVMGRRP